MRAAQKESEKLGILPQQGKDNIGSMFEDVYADVPWHIAEQREQALVGEPRLMPTMNMIQALNDAHKVMMRRDEDIVVFGEDIGFSAASSASPKACRRNSASSARSTRRSAKAASSRPPSAWPPTASSR